MNIFLLLSSEALVGVGVLGIIYAAMSLVLRLAEIPVLSPVDYRDGSASRLSASVRSGSSCSSSC